MGGSSAVWAAVAQAGLLVVLLAAVHVPLGEYLARVFTSTRHLRVERLLYRAGGIDPDADQRWPVYARSVLGFSAASVLLVYLVQRVQGHLPLRDGMDGVSPEGAWNVAVSFVTNTDWQWYSGESTMSTLTQMAALAVQNFVSAAVGLAVAVALVRGFASRHPGAGSAAGAASAAGAGSAGGRIGNFWTDLVRGTIRVLLPLAALVAVLLILSGVVQSFSGTHEVTTLAGATQHIPTGPIATQEAIKELGTNGGGYYNANSGHPFESPNPFTNLLEIFALLAIPFSLPYMFGRMVGDRRQGLAVVGVMACIWTTLVAVATWAELQALGTVPQAAGAAMEGKEVRFGPAASALFAVSTTGTSTGAVNASHDSMTALGGGVALVNMMLGEVAPGGVGAGLYGMLVLAVLAVFLAGLMVGRTPTYLGKRIGRREITLVALVTLTMPTLLLVGAALTTATSSVRTASLQESGPHGLSEVLYAYASASNNNGSAFGGFTSGTLYQDVALGLVMLAGRFVPILLVLALAGSLVRQTPVPPSPGTMPTHSPVFASLLTFVVVIVAGLTFFPALALAPFAEALSGPPLPPSGRCSATPRSCPAPSASSTRGTSGAAR